MAGLRAARRARRRGRRQPDRRAGSASTACCRPRLRPGSATQGFEYLDLGRFWQVLLTVGLFFWVVILWRGAARAARDASTRATCPGCSSSPRWRSRPSTPSACWRSTGDNFTTTDFWRFWVVHLWVEDFLELFTTIMVAYIFVLLGVVRERVALTVIYLDIVLYSVGGVIGTMHHLYFSGEPAEHMALGAFFSAAEVIPLTFLTVEAWSFLQLGARQQSKSQHAVPAPLGGDVPGRGRLLELPRRRDLRLPDQPADRLLLRDRHRADRQPRPRGDDGRLRHARRRPGAVLPALPDPGRTLVRQCGAGSASGRSTSGWPGCASRRCFPLGILQLYESVELTATSRRARSSSSTNRTNALLEWLRLPGRRRLHRRRRAPVLYIAYARDTPHASSASRSKSPRTSSSPRSPSRRASPRRSGDEATAARLT